MSDDDASREHRHDASEATEATEALAPELVALADRLAEHVHDAWMRMRVAEGWSYARERDDARKTHPCLVPYEALSEADKECDRQVSLATLRAIERLGFAIVKRG